MKSAGRQKIAKDQSFAEKAPGQGLISRKQFPQDDKGKHFTQKLVAAISQDGLCDRQNLIMLNRHL